MPVNADVVAFRFDERAMNRLLRGRSGPVARELARYGIVIEGRAKRNASGRPGPNVDTGRLRSSITWRIGEDAEGLYVDIGTNVPYGRYLELGMIPGGKKYPFLRPALNPI